MRSFFGYRDERGCCVNVVDDGVEPVPGSPNSVQPLPLHLEVWNHSPTGFEWGYGGSGPAQLALAILAEVLGPKKRLAVEVLHQSFKWDYVAKWGERWRITEDEVKAWVRAQAEGMRQAEAEGDELS